MFAFRSILYVMPCHVLKNIFISFSKFRVHLVNLNEAQCIHNMYLYFSYICIYFYLLLCFQYAFYFNYALSEVFLSTSLTSIDMYAFAYSSLLDVTVPSSVTFLGQVILTLGMISLK